MRYDFLIGPFNWNFQLSDDGITISSDVSNRYIAWSDVTGAGISPKKGIRRSPGMPASDDIFPGLGRLDGFARRMQDTTELLLIAYRGAHGGKKLVTLNIPNSGETLDSLVDDLSSRLGDRWIGDGMDQLELRKALGFSNWWIMPAAAASVTVVAAALLGWWYLQDKFWIPLAVVTVVIFVVTRLGKK